MVSPSSRITSPRWAPGLATLAIGIALIGCMDGAGDFSSIVVNESADRLVVRYTPTDPDVDVRSVTVEPHQGGQGLGDSFQAFRGGSITIFAADCRQVGMVRLDHPVWAVRVSSALDVVEIDDDVVPALAKMTFLDEVSGDEACSGVTLSHAN